MVLAALENQDGPPRDIVALNAGASIYIAGLPATLADGVARARETLRKRRRPPQARRVRRVARNR